MTHNLKLFTLFSLVWAVGFFAILNWALYNEDTRGPLIGLAAIIYGVGFSIAGSQLGKRDSARSSRGNLSLKYAVAGPLGSMIVASFWVALYDNGSLRDWLIMLLISAVAVGIYYLISRKFIKGIPPKALFK